MLFLAIAARNKSSYAHRSNPAFWSSVQSTNHWAAMPLLCHTKLHHKGKARGKSMSTHLPLPCEEYYFDSTTYSLQNHMSVSHIIYWIITEPLFNFNLQLTSHSVLEIAVPEFELPPVDDSDREYRPLFLL